jgi:predicted acetyltransferase
VTVEIRTPGEDEFEAVVAVRNVAFGEDTPAEDVRRSRSIMPLERILVAFEGSRPVVAAAAVSFELTVPGAVLPAAGVTWVGVLPTHRRRGILRQLMRRELDECRRLGEPLAALWASEAARVFPDVYERVRRRRPGMLSRSDAWWNLKLTEPAHARDARPKLNALFELDGEPAGFARYSIVSKWERALPVGEVNVIEVIATSRVALRELWGYLFSVDLVARVKQDFFDPGSPLFLLVVEPRRLHVTLFDGLWLRLVDVGEALRRRSYADLASLYLGARSASQLRGAARLEELSPGAAERADVVFRTPEPPFCPEEF